MKWREPWPAVLHERKPYKIGMNQIKQSLIWASALSAFVILLAALSPTTTVASVLQRIWMILPLSALAVVLVYSANWVLPGTISSGARGLLRESEGFFLLIPWNAITEYKFVQEPRAQVLVASTRDGFSHRLLMPLTLDQSEVEAELAAHRAKHEGKR